MKTEVQFCQWQNLSILLQHIGGVRNGLDDRARIAHLNLRPVLSYIDMNVLPERTALIPNKPVDTVKSISLLTL